MSTEWHREVRSGRCYLESFCVEDTGCPFLDTCLRSRQPTEPMSAVDDQAQADRLISDLLRHRYPGRLRCAWYRLRVILG